MSKIKVVALTIFLLFLNNCTITRYENYRFLGFGAETDGMDKKIYASVSIDNSLYQYKKTGILRDQLIYKEPYSYYFSICGDFDEIKNLNAYFLKNKTKRINIPIKNKLNKSKTSKFSLCKAKYFFSLGKNLTLPITWEETESLEVVVNFTGIENGKRKKYKLRGKYKKEAIIENTNLKWDAIMGI